LNDFENKLVRKKGKKITIIWTAYWDATEKRMYCVARNGTELKNAEFEKILLADISNLFLQYENLHQLLNKTVRRILDTDDFCMGEIWLLSANKMSLSLVAVGYNTPQMKHFFDDSIHINHISQNEGLPGIAWGRKEITYWENLGENKQFMRREYAKKYGLNSLYTIPLINGDQVIGVLSLGISKENHAKSISNQLFTELSHLLAAEILRKQLEIQLNNIFNSSSDLIIIAGLDGYVKKANPAAKEILEYEVSEIINLPFTQFIHPEDEDITRHEAEKLANGEIIHYFENRLITKTGNIKWIAWTFTPSKEDNLIYGIGKDITEKKILENIFVPLYGYLFFTGRLLKNEDMQQQVCRRF